MGCLSPSCRAPGREGAATSEGAAKSARAAAKPPEGGERPWEGREPRESSASNGWDIRDGFFNIRVRAADISSASNGKCDDCAADCSDLRSSAEFGHHTERGGAGGYTPERSTTATSSP